MIRRPTPRAIYPDAVGLGAVQVAWDARQRLRVWGRSRNMAVNTPASVGVSHLHGPAASFVGNTQAAYLFGGQEVSWQHITFAAVFRWQSGASNNFPQLIGTSTENNGYRLGGGLNGGDLGMAKGAVVGLSPTVTVTSGAPTVVVASHETSGGNWYVYVRRLDTGAIATASGNNTSAALAGNGSAVIGNARLDFTGAWNGDVAMAVIAYEYLPETYALQWLRDPWMLWTRPKSRTWFIPAVAAAGGFQAAWARGANSIISAGVRAA